MLRKFKIAIDGQEYLVEMEEIGAPQPTAPAPAAQHRLPQRYLLNQRQSVHQNQK